MSNFDSKFGSRLNVIYAMHAEPAIALDKYDAAINVNCSVILEFEIERYAVAGIDISAAVAVISARVSELPKRPFKDHKFRVLGKTYYVDEVFQADGTEYKMTVTA